MKRKSVWTLIILLAAFTGAARGEEKPVEKTAPPAQSQKAEKEQWFDLKFVGQEIVEQKKEIVLSPAQALEIFQKEAPHFKADWREKLKEAIEPAPNARAIPEGVLKWMRPKNGPVRAHVMGFSKSFAQIMILENQGNYLWHHFQACQVNFKVVRTSEMDAIFGLRELEKQYSFRVKGIGHGSTPAEAEKVLGNPDGVESFQSVEFYKLYYLKNDVTIVVNEGIVRTVSPGIEEWVKKEIKENGANVQRRM